MANIEIKQDQFSLVGFEISFVLWGWKITLVIGIKATKEKKDEKKVE